MKISSRWLKQHDASKHKIKKQASLEGRAIGFTASLKKLQIHRRPDRTLKLGRSSGRFDSLENGA
jgi:hypothetical protein